MKHAYISIVIPCDIPPSEDSLIHLDWRLSQMFRAHEIIGILPHGTPLPNYNETPLLGPLTIVMTHIRSSPSNATIAGLARAVGDFIIEWRAPLEKLDDHYLNALISPTNDGVELIELDTLGNSRISGLFYWLVNKLRPSYSPVRKTIARAFSRRALGQVLSGSKFEPQIDILVAELSVERVNQTAHFQYLSSASLFQRISEGTTLLMKGTRFGSAIPLGLAAISAAFGTIAAIYAITILIIRGTTPEGWVTLMVLTGLGQAAILSMLGLTWTRIDSLARGLSKSPDATASVYVATLPSNESKLQTKQSDSW